MSKVTILDTTLRDGSYAINFGFTALDTKRICKNLESAGVQYIEIGHGLGLGASEKGCGKAVQTDEEYLEAAAATLKKAKFGMFCVPGIAELKDLDLAARYKMDFVRVGTDVTKVESSAPFIEKAKKLGMFVASNFMKSYASTPDDFAEKVKLSESYGADMVYIVDSAGGMFGSEIRSYFEKIKAASDIQIGFHGHDNLGLAITNSISAAEMGMDFVDSTLQGLGRSAGNAPTEILAAALMKKGFELNLDFLQLLEIGQRFVRPLISSKGYRALDIVSGFADFHSSYMHHIEKLSSKYEVHPAKLIIEATKLDKVSVDIDKLEKIAAALQRSDDVYSQRFEFRSYFGREQDDEDRGK